MQLLRDDDREIVGDVICETQRAGEAVIHDGLIFHASGLNTSDRAYRRASFVYFPADTRYTCVPYHSTHGLGLMPFATAGPRTLPDRRVTPPIQRSNRVWVRKIKNGGTGLRACR